MLAEAAKFGPRKGTCGDLWGSSLLLPGASEAERKHGSWDMSPQKFLSGQRSPCWWGRHDVAHTPPEQVPQKKPGPVHFDCMYVGHFRGHEEGRIPVCRMVYPSLSPRWAQIGIRAAQGCPCWATPFHSQANEAMASASEAQEGTYGPR